MLRRLLFLIPLLAVELPAQGALAVQGFGYPPGQLGAGALGMGGANGEMDPASALNPASIGVTGRFAIYGHFQPEFRKTTIPGGATDRSSALRFPNFAVTGGGGRFTAGISFSTFLDRTWQNSYADSQVVGGETVPSTLTAASDGAINDTRFGLAYVVGERLQVGLGLHALSGQNRIEFGRQFPDSTGIGDVLQRSTISYSGRAISLGVIAQPNTQFVVGVSARFAGEIDLEQGAGIVAKSSLPVRLGAGVSYVGIPSTVVAARVERTTWTALEALRDTSSLTTMHDATEFSLGVESAGPPFAGAQTTLRLGFRHRTLPFDADSGQVKEYAFTGGVAIPLSRGRSQIDVTLQRASRSGGGATEKAWLLSFGLGIRP
jgi:hypothetical protein